MKMDFDAYIERAGWVTKLAVYGLSTALFLALMIRATPWLEQFIAPVLTKQRVFLDADDRSPGRVCWTWYWTKARDAQPAMGYPQWWLAVDGTNVMIPVVVQRQRDLDVLRNVRAAPTGPGQNDFCAIIPAEFDKLSGLSLHGQMSYKSQFGWQLWQDMPAVHVPPLQGPDLPRAP